MRVIRSSEFWWGVVVAVVLMYAWRYFGAQITAQVQKPSGN